MSLTIWGQCTLTDAYTYVHVHTYHICICIHTQTYTYTNVYIHTYIYIKEHMHIYLVYQAPVGANLPRWTHIHTLITYQKRWVYAHTWIRGGTLTLTAAGVAQTMPGSEPVSVVPTTVSIRSRPPSYDHIMTTTYAMSDVSCVIRHT